MNSSNLTGCENGEGLKAEMRGWVILQLVDYMAELSSGQIFTEVPQKIAALNQGGWEVG